MNGAPARCADQMAAVGTLKLNEPSPHTAKTGEPGRASFTPSAPATAQPSAGEPVSK